MFLVLLRCWSKNFYIFLRQVEKTDKIYNDLILLELLSE